MNKNACAGLSTFRDYRDKDFVDTMDDRTKRTRIRTVSQIGHDPGHFLKFQNDTLISTASYDEADIRIQSDAFDDYKLLVISSSDTTTKALKFKSKDDDSYCFTVEDNPKIASLNRASDAMTELSDFLFKRFPVRAGSSHFYLVSYTTTNDGKSLLLAVDEQGHLRMDDPPRVDENDPDSVTSDDKNLFILM